MHGVASTVKRNWGLINSHYLSLPDKWNDLLSSCWKFNQIPANSKYTMWKMDKFGGCLQLESHWMENKVEVSSISWISEVIWSGGIFSCCHYSVPVYTTHSLPIWYRKQFWTFLDSDISIKLSPKTLPNAQVEVYFRTERQPSFNKETTNLQGVSDNLLRRGRNLGIALTFFPYFFQSHIYKYVLMFMTYWYNCTQHSYKCIM